MKAHLAKVSLALVSAVFILGCQDLGSGPVGPEGPQFDKEVDGEHGTIKPHGGDKGNEETATFTATFTLAGDSDDNQLPANLQTAFPGPRAELKLSFFRKAPTGGGYTDAEGANCFGAGPFSGTLAVRTKQNQPTFGQVDFFFDAKGKNGSKVVNYGLFMFADEVDGDLPPASGSTTTITGGTFLMAHSNGPGHSVACTGEGILDFSLLIVPNA